MVKKIINIIKGTFYNITHKKQILADKRLSICKNCENRKDFMLGDVCGLCGCILDSKTRVLDEKCEMNKW